MSESTHPLSSPVTPSSEDQEATQKIRQHPIPPASHPRQYRAIGIVRGKYTPEDPELISKGAIATADGDIEAVLLGRVISLIKNHIDLDQEHVWVVYPRTRQDDNHLHLQILGIWEPETLDDPDALTESIPTSDQVEDGYFSIRGQVVFYDAESKKVIVKIRQSPKKPGEKPKFFKIQLVGALPERPVNHFYDLQAKLLDQVLMIQTCEDMGYVGTRRKGGKPSPGRKPFNRDKSKPRPVGDRPSEGHSEATVRARPVPRPKPKDSEG
ncbi:MAG: hypothetical protein VKJ86_07785 [Synechococcus sp.]|nr:hypothetical protein [Synechococcus sp.]